MSELHTEDVDVLVIGGGPAGMAAGTTTAAAGLRTLLVEQRTTLGGQVYRQRPAGVPTGGPGQAHRAAGARRDAAYAAAGGLRRTGCTVWDLAADHAMLTGPHGAVRVTFRAAVVAAGAFDLPVPFPGWTLSGVLTAGGAHALMVGQGISPGRRVVLAGTGPLLIAFAADMVRAGVDIAGVFDPAPALTLRHMLAVAAVGSRTAAGRHTLWEGAGHLAVLRRAGVRITPETVLVRAEGDQEVSAVVLATAAPDFSPVLWTERTVEADAVCVGYGFRPSTELLDIAGCPSDGSGADRRPVLDAAGRTPVSGIYAAGDGVVPEGSTVAEASGLLTGAAVLEDLAVAGPDRRSLRRARAARDNARRVRAAMDRGRTPAAGMPDLSTDSTLLCRCESVSRATVTAAIAGGARTPDAVKAVTRAGMGACQGRNCELAICAQLAAVPRPEQAGAGFRRRPPARPVPLSQLVQQDQQQDPDRNVVTGQGSETPVDRGRTRAV
ncbi:FAD-dependent oxidoreductase [Nakamurella sp. YIM 132087]|uniref:FAD-dependent oxidoreductase n=1 Tax=Nakamurella alba TaxID=2665158 RepID=A0A7K1FWH1_9ACTN|nr:NAD(P)/FAD-dependent oxidoreductase [Nakamurella alba]MTD17164.1 FAD-dependent oxidoreductase [Nakamurella alba]